MNNFIILGSLLFTYTVRNFLSRRMKTNKIVFMHLTIRYKIILFAKLSLIIIL